jgi:hypothetical protein
MRLRLVIRLTTKAATLKYPHASRREAGLGLRRQTHARASGKAISQFVGKLFRGSQYSKNSENDHTNASNVDEGHSGSVCTLYRGRYRVASPSTRLDHYCHAKTSQEPLAHHDPRLSRLSPRSNHAGVDFMHLC